MGKKSSLIQIDLRRNLSERTIASMLGALITLLFLGASCFLVSRDIWHLQNNKIQRWTDWTKSGKAAECHVAHLKAYSGYKLEIERQEKLRVHRCRAGDRTECLFNLTVLDTKFDRYTKFGDKEIRKACGDEFFDLSKPDIPQNLTSIYWDQVNIFGLEKVGFFALLSAVGIFAFFPVVSKQRNNL